MLFKGYANKLNEKQVKKVELLLPAGNIEKMRYAINYGADAVYMGLSEFSLRSMKAGEIITTENIKTAIETAHLLNAKVYVTFNIFARNADIDNMREKIELLQDLKPDALIFSDFGVYNLLKKHLPDIPLHVSTQTNSLNYETVKFWKDQGAKRVILARELSIPEIARIKKEVPDIEIETFVHGSQCVSYSGRCLLSDYFTHGERTANQGGCAQPCRWSYKIIEETRPGEYYQVSEDEKGTYIFSPKDLALVEHIGELIDAGVDSFKVEGRTKSVYYASVVAKTYKKAIEAHCNHTKADFKELLEDLSKVGNRQFTKGFLLGKVQDDEYNYLNSKGQAMAKFLGLILDNKDEKYLVKVKNTFRIGEEVQIITPLSEYNVKVANVINQYEEETDVAKTNEEVYIGFESDLHIKDWKNGIIRKLGA